MSTRGGGDSPVHCPHELRAHRVRKRPGQELVARVVVDLEAAGAQVELGADAAGHDSYFSVCG